MNNKPLAPVRTWAWESVSDIFATSDWDQASEGAEICGSEITPVTIQSAEWLTREAFEAAYRAAARICGAPCWFKTEDGFTYLGVWWQGMYRGYRLNTVSEEIFPAPEGVVLSVLPIPTPEAPSAQESE